jgi:hypothetical protein
VETVAFVGGPAVGNVVPFWALYGLYFFHNKPYVVVIQLIHSWSNWIPAGCGYSYNNSHLLDVCLRLDFLAVGTAFLVWSSRKGINNVVLSALTVLGREAVLLQVLNPAGGLSLKVLKTLEPATA